MALSRKRKNRGKGKGAKEAKRKRAAFNRAVRGIGPGELMMRLGMFAPPRPEGQ